MDRNGKKMAKLNKQLIIRTLARGLVAGPLTIGTAVLLYATMGASILSAVLFAIACFVINILTAGI
jgi:hypothetical protein